PEPSVSATSRKGTRRSGAASGVEWIFREPDSGPVVTFGSRPPTCLFIGSPPSEEWETRVENGLLRETSLSLRRRDPDQVQRVTASPLEGPAVSQPLDRGSPRN